MCTRASHDFASIAKSRARFAAAAAACSRRRISSSPGGGALARAPRDAISRGSSALVPSSGPCCVSDAAYCARAAMSGSNRLD